MLSAKLRVNIQRNIPFKSVLSDTPRAYICRGMFSVFGCDVRYTGAYVVPSISVPSATQETYIQKNTPSISVLSAKLRV